MRAMVFQTVGQPLLLHEVSKPVPGPGQVLVKVSACGVCRTDLHVLDGELVHPKLPLIPGHEIVGQVEAAGEGAGHFQRGERVGIPWLGWTCGKCAYCLSVGDIFAITPASPAIRSMEAMQNSPWPTPGFVLRFLAGLTMYRVRHCSAPD
jgi:D-arabinose 1-dehydrogenase-like Zn-dependent alcohol dehydrogenase